ncbi:uncharacterized protein LOC135138016 [Zophobas morio]|uniref:uncharacterized protein LOC135138016 n=1 Tax=Zophobas morio TaxID=2755281 RepID=UPI00308278E3
MDSSSDEEIRKLEEELKRKIELRRRKKHEQGNNSVLRKQSDDENPGSLKMQAEVKTFVDNQHNPTEENMQPTETKNIDAETTKTFKKRPGTTDKGRKYEDMITTNIILQMVSDSKIRNFYVSSNDASFGDFDDVVIEVETDRGTHTKAIQLKHTSRGTLTKQQLLSKKGDFCISKYFNSTKNIQDKAQQFILFTNKEFNIADKTKLKLEGEEFHIELIKVSASENSAEDLGISKNINYWYKFQIIEEKWSKEDFEKIQHYKTFFERFRLYTNQERLENLTKSTMDRFTEMFCSNEETFDAYFKFISEWSLKEGLKEKLSKKFTQRLIALRLLSPYIEPFAFGPVSDDMRILRDAIYQFDITLLQEEGTNRVKKLWGDLDKNLDFNELNKVRTRYSLSSAYIASVENLDENMLTQLLWLMDKSPLIVKEHKNIEKAVQLCRDKKFVLLSGGGCREWMEDRSVFQNLSHLESKLELYEKMLQNFTISLQGKNAVNLKTAFEQNKTFLKHVSVNKLLEMSNGLCYIGGQKETFPNLYIDRCLSVNIIDTEYLEVVSQNTVIILNCDDNNYKQIKISRKHTLMDINDFFVSTTSKICHTPVIIMSKNKCSESDFQKVCTKIVDSKIVHYFEFLNNKDLQWVRSRGDVSELRKYKSSSHSKNESKIWSSEFSNKINLVIGDPGMGKTELTKSLKNNCCSKYWTVIMNPQDVNSLFKILQTSDYLNRFESFILNEKYPDLEQFDREFFKMCLNQNHVVYVWDALDEILTKNLDAVSDLILLLSQRGFVQWVTARQHLRSFLEKKFNVLSVSINQFSETEQDDYIRKRLSNLISSVDMKITIEKIKSTFAFTKHVDILGIPLQIFMVTEIFRQNKETCLELLNNRFLLTDLYRYFIDGKFRFFFGGKVPVVGDYWEAEIAKKKEEKLKQYEKFALELIFPEETLKELKIDYARDVNLVSEDFATVGIVTGLQNGIPQFVHASFAEYFVALFFSRNWKKLSRDIFFDQKYNNVRFFFDILTGKNSSVHIAVLYRNFDELRSYNDQMINRKDDVGRSALHLLCSWGSRYPRLKVQERDDRYVIAYDNREYMELLETGEYFQALQILLNKCEISEQDLLFKITPLECCRETESLGAELELLQSRKLQFQQSYNRNDRINILYYSAQFGYDEAIKMVIPEDVDSCYKEVNFISHFGKTPLLMASRKGYATVVEYLVKCGAKIYIADYFNQTPLHGASSKGHEKVVEYLVKCEAKINCSDLNRETPLFAASSNGHEKVVEYLAECKADVNHVNIYGKRPLHGASSKGHEKTVECLVKHRANIDHTDNDGCTPLFTASSNGHENIVQFLVKSGAGINLADKHGQTPLFTASSNSHENIVQFLVKSGAGINLADKHGQTPLFIASSNGHENIVQFLVKSGAGINLADKHGQTPLFTASSNGHEHIVQFLVKSGAGINLADKHGQTPLFTASSNGHENIVQFLVKSGAGINLADKHGQTPLFTASSNGHEHIVQFLVKSGAGINLADKHGQTPLFTASSNGHENIVQFLVKSGAGINLADKHGQTPLFTASSNDHENIVQFLVKSGAGINLADKHGQTPLFTASSNGHENIVQFLVKSGAGIDLADKYGQTPLFVASSQGHEKIVDCLVKCKVDIDHVDNDGWTPLYVASYNGHKKTVQCLVIHKAQIDFVDKYDRSPLYAAVSNGHEEVVQYLVECGVRIHRVDKCGEPPLYAASSKSQKRIVQYLRKCDAEINRLDENGCTPLYQASENGCQEIVQDLVKCGANINFVNTSGKTPLYVASRNGYEEIVKCLVKCGADINHDVYGKTPLYVASENGHEKVVTYLVENGAEINRTDYTNCQTPLYVASENGHEKVVTYLVENGAEINRTDCTNRQTPLYVASANGHEKVVTYLVENRALINCFDYTNVQTPLYVASRNGYEKVVTYLVENGAIINPDDYPNLKTPLYVASENGHEKVVTYLVEKGAKVNNDNYRGRTPLHAGSENGHEKIVKFLVKRGAEINRADEDGQTPLCVAFEKGHTQVVEYLRTVQSKNN